MNKKKKYAVAAFAVGISYRLLMGVQGIDTTDMGFCMTFYQNIFTHPEALTFYFNYYLTGLIGGLWHLLFGQFGLQGFRLLETFTLSSAILLLYQAFRPWLPPRVGAAAIVLSFLFPSIIVTFHYDTFSFLLIAASVFGLAQWHRNGSQLWLAMAGMMIGLSFFARVINGFLFWLILFPIIWGLSESRQRAYDNGAYFGGGMMAGCMVAIGLMAVLGHLSYFAEALNQSFGSLYGHNNASGVLIGSYLKSYVNIALQILAIAMMALYFGDGGHLAPRLRTIVRTVMIAALVVLVLTSQPHLSTVAICTLVIVITRPLPLAFYALACAYLFPLGSTAGIPSLLHWCAGLLIIPAATCFRRLASQWQRTVICLLALVIAATMVYKMGVYAYGESEPRTSTFTPALPGTLNTLTDSERAQRYRNEVARIMEYGRGNDLLLIANQASELYYATGKLPFLGNTQTGAYTEDALTARLDDQLNFYGGRLPLIVFINRGHDSDDMAQFRKYLFPWMDSHRYTPVYHDDDISIYVDCARKD